MSTDVKKHTSFAAGEVPKTSSLVASILSINDVVPVANATEAAQVAASVVSAGQVLSSAPLTVARADAPGMHRIELSTDGSVWRPVSGVLHFASTSARDTWTTSNSALLTAGDTCLVSGVEYSWNGTAWQLGYVTQTLGFARNATGTAQGSIGATNTALTSIAFTLVLPTAMNVRFRFGALVYASDTTTAISMSVYDGATQLFAAALPANSSPGTAATSNGITQEQYVPGMASGSHSITLQAQRAVGTGTVTVTHASTWPTWLIAETY